MRRPALLLVALLLGGCQPEEPPENRYMTGGRVECGRINATDLLGLREREAARYAREGGCALHVVTRDGRSLVRPDLGPPPDPDVPQTEVNVTVLDGYVHRLGR